MTLRSEAEALLFKIPTLVDKRDCQPVLTPPTRRRLEATYCPRCTGWVEVRLQPVRLRCTGCGLEAKP